MVYTMRVLNTCNVELAWSRHSSQGTNFDPCTRQASYVIAHWLTVVVMTGCLGLILLHLQAHQPAVSGEADRIRNKDKLLA